MWFWEQSERGLQAVVPNRPWYGHKDAVSFEDILRTARVALGRDPLLAQVEALAPLRRVYRRAGPSARCDTPHETYAHGDARQPTGTRRGARPDGGHRAVDHSLVKGQT
ncbi:MAG: hypothetical protein IPF99_08170 [Deltaproteobacteria bacterium]|nr:hypothetical protein [Deltaproteobacteria bacterium]